MTGKPAVIKGPHDSFLFFSHNNLCVCIFVFNMMNNPWMGQILEFSKVA